MARSTRPENDRLDDKDLDRFDRFLLAYSRRDLLKRGGGVAALIALMASGLPLAACATGTTAAPSASAAGPTLAPVKGGIVTEGNIQAANDFSPINRSGTAVHINLRCFSSVSTGRRSTPMSSPAWRRRYRRSHRTVSPTRSR